MSRTALIPLSVALALVACQPPELEGSDQVADSNIHDTYQKDRHWNYAKNTFVDGQIDALLDESPGCAVGIMVDGEIDYLHGYGWANPALAPGGDHTVYTELGDKPLGWGKAAGEYDVGTTAPIGSVSKVYTALAAMQIVQGPWDLDDTVDDVLTGATGDIADLTLEDLLAHRKAVGVDDDEIDLTGTPDEIAAEKKKGAVMAFSPNFDAMAATDSGDMIRPRLAFDEYDDELVSEHDYYSNVGFGIIGAMIDQYSMDTYDDGDEETEDDPLAGYEKFVYGRVANSFPWHDQRNAASPALLHSWRANDIPRQTRGYRWVGGEWVRLDAWDYVVNPDACVDVDSDYDMDDPDEADAFFIACNNGYEGWEGPAGGWTMTIGDLTRLGIALQENTVVTKTTRTIMANDVTDLPGVGLYGLGVQASAGGDRIRHDGRIGSNIATFSYWPAPAFDPLNPPLNSETQQTDMAVAIQCNGQVDPDDAPGGLRDAADAIYAHYKSEGYLMYSYDPGSNWLPDGPTDPIGGGTVLSNSLFELELETARVTSPANLWLPLAPDSSSALLSVDKSVDGGVVSKLAVGTVRSGSATQDTRYPSLSMGTDAFSTDPKFGGSSTGVFKLPTTHGNVILEQPSFTAHATSRGASLVEVSISGQLDLRSVVGLGTASERADLCRAYGTRSACEPCDDGKNECLTVTIEHVQGTKVTGSVK